MTDATPMPCPFCGGSLGYAFSIRDGNQVACNGCHAMGPPRYHPKTRSDAIAAWDARAVNAHDGMAEALDDCIKRLRACVIHAGTDPEFADGLVEKYSATLAAAREPAP